MYLTEGLIGEAPRNQQEALQSLERAIDLDRGLFLCNDAAVTTFSSAMRRAACWSARCPSTGRSRYEGRRACGVD